VAPPGGRDFYQVLGVPRTASPDELQRAYRKLARTYHPDVNKEAGAEDRFKEVSEAYDVLGDPDTRRRYDAFGPSFRQVPEGVDPETWASAQQGGRPRASSGAGRDARSGGRSGPGSYTWSSTGGGDDPFADFAGGRGFDAGDIDIEDLLGGFFNRGAGGAGPRRRGPARGSDVEAEISLTIEEAFTGGQRRLTMSGSGGERSIEVNIPAGVIDGQRIRLAGQGSPGQEGSAGDLYLVVRIRPHRRYRLEGRDIFVDLPITPWEAVLGAKVPVDTPGGGSKVTVPDGSSSGRRLRLRGQGMPNPKGKPGDLYAEVKIMVPKKPTTKERELFEQLATVSDFDPRARR
jgi:curved DNA-binding protein